MRLFAFIALLLCSCLPVSAQDKPLPPPRDFKPETKEAADVLPALFLPEYVITGSDLISFTEDRKEILEGPDSRAFTARAGRGAREQRFMDTAPTRMPLRKPDLTGSEHVFLTRLGYGGFATPHVHMLYGDRYSLGDAHASLMYESSDGHVARADYTRVQFAAGGGTYLPRTLTPILSSSRLQGGIRADVHEYGLYADKLPRERPSPEFRRNALSVEAEAGLLSRRNTLFDHELHLRFGHTAIDEEFSLLDTMQLAEYSAAETRIALDGEAEFHSGAYPIHTNAFLHVNDLTERSDASVRPFFIGARGGSRHRLGEATTLSGALAFWLYRGSDHAAQFRVYPQLRLQHMLSDDWSLEAAYAPAVEERTLAGLLEQNPYLMLAADIRQTDVPLRFEAAASYDNRASTAARIGLRWSSSSSWPRFSLLPDPVRQQWQVLYNGRTDVTEVRGQFKHAFSPHTHLQADAVIRVSGNDELDGNVPYLPNHEWRVLIGHRFPFDLHVQSTLQLVGEREITGGGTLNGWMLLGLEIEYRLLRNAALFLRFDNLLDQNYEVWDGYRARPFFAMGGIIIRL